MTGTHYHANLVCVVTVALTAAIAGETHQRGCAARESDAGVRIAGAAQACEEEEKTLRWIESGLHNSIGALAD